MPLPSIEQPLPPGLCPVAEDEPVPTRVEPGHDDNDATETMNIKEEASAKLAVLLVFEDGATARRGKRAMEQVLNQAAGVDGEFHVWRHDMLGDPAWRAEAARQALDADILLVSVHGFHRLAPEAEASLKDWVTRKRRRPCTLVVSLDADAPPRDDSDSALMALRTEAARNGLTVLLQLGEAASPEIDAAITRFGRHDEAGSFEPTPILGRPGSRQRQHWGIND